MSRRVLSEREQQFFAGFFNRLAAAGIPAIVLRNYEDFPQAIGHDLDVFFRRAQLGPAVRIFREELGRCGGDLVHVHERDYVLCAWFQVDPAKPDPLHLDFYHGAFTWHGLEYLSEEELVGQSREAKGLRVPRPAHEALSLFLISILWGGFYKDRYASRICGLLAGPDERKQFDRLLERHFGPGAHPPFKLEGPVAAPIVAPYAAKLRRRLKVRSLARNPVRALWRTGRFWAKEIWTAFRPPGICIALMGPDGSGKSTVLDLLTRQWHHCFGELVNYHWRPGVLPEIGVLLGERKPTGKPVTAPHGKPAHSGVVSLARFAYYGCDYWLGFPWRVQRPKAKNHLVIFDRYAPDMWCDPARYRLRRSNLIRACCRFLPQPDRLFVLLAPAATIRSRKQEVPVEELEAMLRNYEALSRHARAEAIDCSRPPEQVAESIGRAMLDVLRKKAARHRLFGRTAG